MYLYTWKIARRFSCADVEEHFPPRPDDLFQMFFFGRRWQVLLIGIFCVLLILRVVTAERWTTNNGIKTHNNTTLVVQYLTPIYWLLGFWFLTRFTLCDKKKKYYIEVLRLIKRSRLFRSDDAYLSETDFIYICVYYL